MSNWRILAKSFKVGFTPITIPSTRYLNLDPAYPDIYLPSSDFKEIGERINTLSKSNVCDFISGTCFHDMTCDKVV